MGWAVTDLPGKEGVGAPDNKGNHKVREQMDGAPGLRKRIDRAGVGGWGGGRVHSLF